MSRHAWAGAGPTFPPFQAKRPIHRCRPLAALLLALIGAVAVQAETSALWGAHGERWTPDGRLPDFSYAGYHCGEAPLPTVAPGVSVRTFGAKGDGVTDDTQAFLKALASVKSGAIEIPAGRYRITSILSITRSGLVLRGAGPDKTILFFPTPLNEIRPNWGATTTGERTSNYSWSGGFVWFQGDPGNHLLTTITAPAQRGATSLRVATTNRLRVGQQCEIYQTDTTTNTLAASLYSGDPGDTRKLHGSTRASLVCRLQRIVGNEIFFDRPLRCDVALEWKPVIRNFAPAVSESGVENLAFEFPVTPYKGHFTELGFNAVAFSGVVNCWARHLRVVNADSGFFPNGHFCTIQDVVFESARPPAAGGCTGHHGIYFGGDDNLFRGFDYRTRFIHDITVSQCAGNVAAGGQGVDLCLDHHERAPYDNLFTSLDAGAGTRLWHCGGGEALGKHCAGRGTFWNIRAATPQHYPPASFGPDSMNLVAVQPGQPSQTSAAGRWFEAIAPDALTPPDLHAAQLARRLGTAPRP